MQLTQTFHTFASIPLEYELECASKGYVYYVIIVANPVHVYDTFEN